MSWIWLIAAGLLEIGWAVGLKYTGGFARLWPSVATVLLLLASFWCLAQATAVVIPLILNPQRAVNYLMPRAEDCSTSGSRQIGIS